MGGEGGVALHGTEGSLVLGRVRAGGGESRGVIPYALWVRSGIIRYLATTTVGWCGILNAPPLPVSYPPPFMSMQDQDCYGGCFQASKAFVGDMAGVRIWRRVLPKEEVRGEWGLGENGGKGGGGSNTWCR